MIARNKFRMALYKLILLKNIVETKVHKEKMQMLFAFEQLIINTEDFGAEEEEADDADNRDFTKEEQLRLIQQEDEPFLKQQLEEMFNPLYQGMRDPEQYFQNSDDIINEEELEESVCESRRQTPMKNMTSPTKL